MQYEQKNKLYNRYIGNDNNHVYRTRLIYGTDYPYILH